MSSFRRPVPLLRITAGAYLTGRWLEGTRQPITITASVQPASGEDMQSLPENRRSGAAYALFSDFAFRTVDEGGKSSPDIVLLADGEYEVSHVEPWQNNVINHHKALVTRVVTRPLSGQNPLQGLVMGEGPVIQ